jgi:hypothetical protein
MPLFIKDVPFFQGQGTNPEGEEFEYVEVRLPMSITEPVGSNPPDDFNVDFVLDTGSDTAIVSQDHLRDSHIPLSGASGGRIWVTWADGTKTLEQTRDASLWLYSNLSQWKDRPPYKIELNGGVVVCKESKSSIRPLLGLNQLVDAGLRIELDAEKQLISVWVPDDSALVNWNGS